ncbi:MAG: hypothetical protein IT353_03175 [Gemmatimonadaceae bacterium]|nr:hypothetical protein [Gemmatimonadaceae bacterium]
MLRLISSVLLLLLGTAASPTRVMRPRSTGRPRGRQRPDEDGGAARTLEVSERPRAKARRHRWSWTGSVDLEQRTHTTHIPGTWTLLDTPFHRVAATTTQSAAPIPDVTRDPAAWAARMSTVLSMQEPGARLRVGTTDNSGWQTLEVAIPTLPPTIVQVDHHAVSQILKAPVTIRLRISA